MKVVILREQYLERLKLLFDTTEMVYNYILTKQNDKQYGNWKETIRFSHNEFRVLFNQIQSVSLKIIDLIQKYYIKYIK